jgi:hypothetical protein
MWKPSKTVWYSLIIVGVVVLLALLSKWSERANVYSPVFLKKVKLLVEQCTRWNGMAQQDSNPLIQLIHCDYALAYAQVARNLVSAEDIEKITGIDINELVHYMEDCQSYAIQKIGNEAPKIKVEGSYSVGSGWV